MGLTPDKIDPITKAPQTPLLMYDQLIVGRSAEETAPKEKEGAEETEIHEYRVYVSQLANFKKYYPTAKSFPELMPPAQISKEIITCDNSEFSSSDKNDNNRKGITYSTPFYDPGGNFKGLITAVVRTNVLRKNARPKKRSAKSGCYLQRFFFQNRPDWQNSQC